MITQEQLKALDEILPEIRHLRQTLVSRDVGLLTELKIHFGNSAEPTVVKIDGGSSEDSVRS
jgi:hypothetical protein